MVLDRRLMAMATVAVIALMVMAAGGVFAWNMFIASPEQPREPAAPEPAAFMMRDAAPCESVPATGPGAQLRDLPVQPQVPPGVSEWSPVFAVSPQIALSGLESFAGPEGTPVEVPAASPEAQPEPRVEVQRERENDTPAGDDAMDESAPETPGARIPGIFA